MFRSVIASAVIVAAIGVTADAARRATLEPADRAAIASPIFARCSPQTVRLGETLKFQVRASDPAGDVPTLKVEGPPGLSMSSDVDGKAAVGTVSWTPTGILPGAYGAIFTATDDAGHRAILSVAITVTAPSAAPRFVSVPSGVVVAEGQPLSLHVRAVDDAGGPLELSAAGLPADLHFTDEGGGSGQISGTFPSNAHVSSPYAVTIVASGGNGQSATASVLIRVTDAGGPPVFTPCPSQTAHVNMVLTFQVSASSPTGAALTMTSAGPAGMSVSTLAVGGTVTGTVSWTPSSSDLGSATVTLTASDAAGHQATLSVAISVVR